MKANVEDVRRLRGGRGPVKSSTAAAGANFECPGIAVRAHVFELCYHADDDRVATRSTSQSPRAAIPDAPPQKPTRCNGRQARTRTWTRSVHRQRERQRGIAHARHGRHEDGVQRHTRGAPRRPARPRNRLSPTKGTLPLPSNITRECPLFLLILQGNALPSLLILQGNTLSLVLLFPVAQRSRKTRACLSCLGRPERGTGGCSCLTRAEVCSAV